MPTLKETAIALVGAAILYVAFFPLLFVGNAVMAFLIDGLKQVLL